MLAKEPKIARFAHRVGRRIELLVRQIGVVSVSLFDLGIEDHVDLGAVPAEHLHRILVELDYRGVLCLERVSIPGGELCQPVVRQAIRADLRGAPVVRDDDGNLRQASTLRRFGSGLPGDDRAVLVDQDRDRKAKLPHCRDQLDQLFLRMLAGVILETDQGSERAVFNWAELLFERREIVAYARGSAIVCSFRHWKSLRCRAGKRRDEGMQHAGDNQGPANALHGGC